MDAKTERLIAAIRAWAARRPNPGVRGEDAVPSTTLTPPSPAVQRELAEMFLAKKAELEATGLLPPSLGKSPPRRAP